MAPDWAIKSTKGGQSIVSVIEASASTPGPMHMISAAARLLTEDALRDKILACKDEVFAVNTEDLLWWRLCIDQHE